MGKNGVASAETSKENLGDDTAKKEKPKNTAKFVWVILKHVLNTIFL
jgi:hypothetical protein